MSPRLNHSLVTAAGASPEKWIYLLHGIYGSGRNWGSIARRFVDERTEWGVVLVDLRLHGSSHGFAPPHTMEAVTRDVIELEQALGLPASVVIGHSFGGKVALLLGAEPDPPEQIWVADSTLQTGEPEGTAWKVIGITRGLPSSFATRELLADAMVANGYERAVGMWLGMNLERAGTEFRWKLDWAGVEEMLRDYFAADVWGIIEQPPAETRIHMIRAVKSDSIDEESATRIRAAGEATGRVYLHDIDAGHWLNVDNPDALLGLLLENV